MRVTLTRHGGHMAGMRIPPRTVDAAALDAASAERLQTLAQEVVNSPPAPARVAPDALSYTVTIEDDNGRSTTVRATDPITSASFAALLDFIERL